MLRSQPSPPIEAIAAIAEPGGSERALDRRLDQVAVPDEVHLHQRHTVGRDARAREERVDGATDLVERGLDRRHAAQIDVHRAVDVVRDLLQIEGDHLARRAR